MKGKRPRPLQWFRYSVQTIVALYVLTIVIGNTVGERWAANLHTICPFGGVANIYTFLAGDGYVAKLHSAVFVMLLALVIGLVLTGKSFCGWICPLGSVQQGMGWIGERLWPRAYNRAPRWLERILHYLKWLVLIWVLVQTARSGRLVFQDWDPYYNLYHIWTDEVAISGYVVTGLTLAMSLFILEPSAASPARWAPSTASSTPSPSSRSNATLRPAPTAAAAPRPVPSTSTSAPPPPSGASSARAA